MKETEYTIKLMRHSYTPYPPYGTTSVEDSVTTDSKREYSRVLLDFKRTLKEFNKTRSPRGDDGWMWIEIIKTEREVLE